jgi:hypothetical protein
MPIAELSAAGIGLAFTFDGFCKVVLHTFPPEDTSKATVSRGVGSYHLP